MEIEPVMSTKSLCCLNTLKVRIFRAGGSLKVAGVLQRREGQLMRGLANVLLISNVYRKLFGEVARRSVQPGRVE